MLSLYEQLQTDPAYIKTVAAIENMQFIQNGKWDWEHGRGHFQRVALYVKNILEQLDADERTIDLGMCAALLHDIGLTCGYKSDHAKESYRLFKDYLNGYGIHDDEMELIGQAILDHSNGDHISSLIDLALVLADKCDVTYHRTIHSSIQDEMNKEIQKIKQVTITITSSSLIVSYQAELDFDVNMLLNWKKALLIPKKAAQYLNRTFVFMVHDQPVDVDMLLGENH